MWWTDRPENSIPAVYKLSILYNYLSISLILYKSYTDVNIVKIQLLDPGIHNCSMFPFYYSSG